jgi:hypothetical protein
MRSSRISRRRITYSLSLAGLIIMFALASQAFGASPPPSLTAPTAPSASTGGTGHVAGAAVELDGSVNPDGEATSYYFQYGPTVAYGSQTTPGTLPAGITSIRVSQTVSGLLVGYHYRLVAVNGHGTDPGRDRAYTAKATALKVAITKPPLGTQNLVGAPITISGSVTGTGAGNHKVELQATPYPYKEAFAVVGAPLSTDAAGHFTFHVASLTQNTQFRVVTLDPRPTISSTITELAAVRVSLHVRLSSHRGLVRLYGTVSPAEVGAHIVFQLEKKPSENQKPSRGTSERAEEKAELPKFGAEFATVVKRATKTVSRFSDVVTIKRGGRYRALVLLAKGPLASGHSSAITLHAAQASTKKKKNQTHAGSKP